ncbi:MAG: energy-coupling factor ABC transporter ATP-binding protein [Sedimentibacter saalensis]|uniref:energy-coupling factor ABC transporter ATP-binding protein n=1 Tax=Sedimentibacter saalensis TaxID=130788 RepID=UPI002B1E9A43|nr:energy-coupling factor ABC transporter ATP-binding protein [Sedimentibacter saalensis]MEA5096380.1 energy-coupling factor ABC transporter ATP-binding protein [Sedimentibacter saalensis]
MLEMLNVSYMYEDKTIALNNVSIDLKKGKKIGIIGSNGAGKSTLFMNFLGLLKPTKGKIFFDGKELKYDKKTLDNLRKNVGIVFQDPDKQIFFSNVYDDIAFALKNLKYNEEEIKQRVESSIRNTNIAHLRNKPVHFLSYGQKKNVSIAGTVVMDQKIIFFDEPNAGLDYPSKENVKNFLNNLTERENKTIVISSHDMNFIYEICDYIYILNKGCILAEGETREIFLRKEILDEAALEEPFLIKIHKYFGKPICKSEKELFY